MKHLKRYCYELIVSWERFGIEKLQMSTVNERTLVRLRANTKKPLSKGRFCILYKQRQEFNESGGKM